MSNLLFFNSDKIFFNKFFYHKITITSFNKKFLQLPFYYLVLIKKFLATLIVFILLKNSLFAQNLAYSNSKKNQKTFNEIIIKPKLNEVNINNKINTQGHYLTIDFISSKANYDEFRQTKKQNYYDSEDYNSYGYSGLKSPYKTANSLGIRYGYAFNYRGFFLTPEIFYDKINLKTKLYPDINIGFEAPEIREGEIRDYEDIMYEFKSLQIHKIYGLKLNFGFDINSFFSAYISGGLGAIDHSITSGIYDKVYLISENLNFDFNPNPQIRRKTTKPFFGIGLKLKLNDALNLVSEYQRYDIKSPTQTFNANDRKNFEYGSFINAKLVIAKIGLSYNF